MLAGRVTDHTAGLVPGATALVPIWVVPVPVPAAASKILTGVADVLVGMNSGYPLTESVAVAHVPDTTQTSLGVLLAVADVLPPPKART